MRALTVLAIPIYQEVSKGYSSLNERTEATKHHLLNEITHWTTKSLEQQGGYSFKPVEFKGTEDSAPFEIRLIPTNEDSYELKFGNLNAPTDEERYKWDDNDPFKLQKALFLHEVLELKIVPLLRSGKIAKIIFTPYNGDGLGDDRYSYFYNMYSKLGKEEFNFKKENSKETYSITKKKK